MMVELSGKELWNKAIQFLARREYSRTELGKKLTGDAEQVGSVLDELERQGYLSDRRFTESFIRMRVGQGHGQNKIRYELKQKGIASDLYAEVMEVLEIDWSELAVDLYRRKYSKALDADDFKERNKRMRFLSQRGFSMDEINYAINLDE